MSYSSSTLYNGLFIVNGNVLMGNNTPITSTATYPSSLTQLIYSGDDSFNGNGSRYWAATNLALQAQSIADPGGKAWGSRILLEGAKEGLGASRSNGAIQFITGGSEKLRVSDNGLYIFSGNVPARLQTHYNPVSPFDCNFEININYDKLTNTIDGVPYGTASLQVNANQVSGGYISMATGLPNTVPTEVARVTGQQMNVLSISTGSLSVGSNITLSGILTGDGSGLTNLPTPSGVAKKYIILGESWNLDAQINKGLQFFNNIGSDEVLYPSTLGTKLVKIYPSYIRTNSAIDVNNMFSNGTALAQIVYRFTVLPTTSKLVIIHITYSIYIFSGRDFDSLMMYLIRRNTNPAGPLNESDDLGAGYFNDSSLLGLDHYMINNNITDTLLPGRFDSGLILSSRPETQQNKRSAPRGFIRAVIYPDNGLTVEGQYDFVVSNATRNGTNDKFTIENVIIEVTEVSL